MFERLKKWIQHNEKTSLPAGSPSANPQYTSPSPAPVRVSSLEDIAVVFANSLLRPPRAANDRYIAGDLEKEVYSELLKVIKEGVEPDSLPKCPDTITQLLMLLQKDDSTLDEITALINRDQVLATEILKLANSPLFRPRAGEVTSIEEAAKLLGMSKLSALASTTMMKQVLDIKPIYFKHFGSYLWEHSQQCALACGYLAEKAGQDYFSAYLVGLIHDIGKLVIFQELISALRKAHPDIHPNETIIASIVDRVSAQLSCVSLKHWELPISIQIAVCEQAKKKHPDELSELAYILFVANILSEIWILLQKKYIDEARAEELLQEHGLSTEILYTLFAEKTG